MNKTPFLLWLILLFLSHYICAQEVVSSSGSSFKNSTHQLNWTLGEPVIETFVSGQSVLTQGFQQSKLTITAIGQISENEFKLKIYPNPVSAELTVEIFDFEGIINFSLFDINGKLLSQKKGEKPIETIDMQPYLQGSYLLKVGSANGDHLQTYKVIKH
jgi:hypothetical protein